MFQLHERLAADTVPVADWPLCRVLLMNDSSYPWLILVPARPDVTEIHDLSPPDRVALTEEIAQASEAVKRHFGADKMNVAALGNVVPQLHVHVIARFTTDAAWPRPVWGAAPAAPYSSDALADAVARMRAALNIR